MEIDYNKYLISVITPTYNRRNFIGSAINSVLNQSYKNIEHIIVDDGSNDKTSDLVRDIQKSDPRVKYYYQENKGQSSARNFGLKLAMGDFICFLDSDDIFLEEHIEKCLKVFKKNPEVDIVYGDWIPINEKGIKKNIKNLKRYTGKITYQLFCNNCVSMNSVMVRSKCFKEMGGMNENCEVADDYDLWLRLSTKYKFYYIPEPLAYYRISIDQISSNKMKRFEANEKILLNFIRNYPKSLTNEQIKDGLSRFYLRKARYLGSINHKMKGFVCAMKALKYNFFSILVFRGIYRIIFPKKQ
ncbi:glycosyltransferase [Desulfosarcina widdelii]|nr:glycosyltransferase [Desulfosarcina widdelii]